MTSKHGAWLAVALIVVGCGTTGPTAPAATTAMLTVSAFAATVENQSGSTTYHLSLRLTETGGRMGATVNVVAFTFEPGGDQANFDSSLHLAAGSSVDSIPLSLSLALNKVVASQVSVRVAFTDDDGHMGAVTATASVTPTRRFTLSGTVTDSVSAMPVGGAVLFVADGVGESHYVAADSNGRYSVAGIATGTATVDAGATGYDHATPSTVVAGDTSFDLRLDPIVALKETGTASHVLTSWRVGSLEFTNVGGAPGFYYVVSGTPQPGDVLYISAQIDGPRDTGSVTVSIYKHGVLFQTATATGFPSTATASGTY